MFREFQLPALIPDETTRAILLRQYALLRIRTRDGSTTNPDFIKAQIQSAQQLGAVIVALHELRVTQAELRKAGPV